MIIWGFRIVYRMLSSGVFLCPEEGAERPYALKSGQRFFTLFFIPFIPLKKIGNIVECQHCKSKFQESVLQLTTAAQYGGPGQSSVSAESFVEGVRGATVALLRAGTITEVSASYAVRLLANYVPGYSNELLQADLSRVDLTHLQSQLRSLGPTLDAHGKESLLTHLVLIALADKAGINEAERNLLQHYGSDLGLTAVHCRATIDAATGQATPQDLG
jgi:hypothetical protein